MLKPGKVGVRRDGDYEYIYILKARLTGYSNDKSIKNKGECLFSVIMSKKNSVSFGDEILEVNGNTLSQDMPNYPSGNIETRCLEVKWLSEEETKQLRTRNQSIDWYIQRLEEGKPVDWYIGG